MLDVEGLKRRLADIREDLDDLLRRTPNGDFLSPEAAQRHTDLMHAVTNLEWLERDVQSDWIDLRNVMFERRDQAHAPHQ